MTDKKIEGILKQVSNISTVTIPLKELDKLFQQGRIFAIQAWLQRFDQEPVWTRKSFLKAKSYISDLIQNKDSLQSFVLMRAEDVLELVKSSIKDIEDGSILPILEELEKKLETELSSFAEEFDENGNSLGKRVFISLDGQNRLKHAIRKFYDNKFTVPLQFEEIENNGEYLYSDLSQMVQDQIDEIELPVSFIKTISIEKVVKTLVAVNEGEPWNTTEKRSVKFTPISFTINKLSQDPIVSSFFSNILRKSKEYGITNVSGDYKFEKKGDVLILSEFLQYTIYGNFGSVTALNSLYDLNEFDVDTTKKLSLFEPTVKFLVNAFHQDQRLYEKISQISFVKNLYIALSIFSNPLHRLRGGTDLPIPVTPLNKIKDPSSFIRRFLKECASLHARVTDRVKDQVSGRTVPKPGSFAYHHKAQQSIDLKMREKFMVSEGTKFLVKIYNDMIDANELDVSDGARKISMETKMMKQLNSGENEYQRYNGYTPRNKKEFDHIVPIKRGGSNDESNIQLIPKELNRQKGAR